MLDDERKEDRMLVNINGLASKNVKQLTTLTWSQTNDGGLKDFPAIVLDRYSGITGLTIWSRLGEEVGVEGGCYSVYVGSFCPFSSQIVFLPDMDHDYCSVSLSGQIPNLIPISHKKRRKGSIIIQNDVWIGYGVTILGGVTVHNGAVIGANSTVTKDVPPYAIVAGNPAHVVKYRFDPETIERLQRIQWWYWDDKTIKKRSEWFKRSPEEFAEKFDAPFEPGRLIDAQIDGISRENLYLIFEDLDNQYSILGRIIKTFAQTHSEQDCLIVSVPKDGAEERKVRIIYELAEGIESNCGLYVRCSRSNEIPKLISTCGTLITSRVLELVKYTCIADLAHTDVVSGFDVPVFYTISGGGNNNCSQWIFSEAGNIVFRYMFSTVLKTISYFCRR